MKVLNSFKLTKSIIVKFLLFIFMCFSVVSCGNYTALDVALSKLTFNISNDSESIYLAKTLEIVYRMKNYEFDVEWSIKQTDSWSITDSEAIRNCYELKPKNKYGKLHYDLTATLSYNSKTKSKVFSGDYNHQLTEYAISDFKDISNNTSVKVRGYAIDIHSNNSVLFVDGNDSILMTYTSVVFDDFERLIEVSGVAIKDDKNVALQYKSHSQINIQKETLNSIMSNININCYDSFENVPEESGLVQIDGKLVKRNNKYFISDKDNKVTLLNIDEVASFSLTYIDFLDLNTITMVYKTYGKYDAEDSMFYFVKSEFK